MNFHPHIHGLVPCGVFLGSGKFINIKHIPTERFLETWETNVFNFLMKEGKITSEIVENMKSWEHSGFSINDQVYIEKEDKQGIQRVIQYISRCPLSIARFIKITETGKVIYRAIKAACRAFPKLGNEKLKGSFTIVEFCRIFVLIH
jgi:hypothetical protein